ncbi:hypothetical protein [Bacillus sp. JCM 19041]
MDDRLFRTAMSKFATGVTVITTEVDSDVHGMTLTHLCLFHSIRASSYFC